MPDTLPFTIGSDVWPGLAKITEECAELIKVIAKLQANGGDTSYFDGTDLLVGLLDEMADVQASIEFAIRYNEVLNMNVIRARTEQKIRLFETWHNAEKLQRETPRLRACDDPDCIAPKPHTHDWNIVGA
jgi:hypothetical protein